MLVRDKQNKEIIVYELIGFFYLPRGIFADIPHFEENYIKKNILSHVSTLTVGAFRIFGV